MTQVNLGPGAVVHRGEFVPGTAYNKYDEVHGDNGTISGTFRSVKANNTDPLNDVNSWDLVSEDGEKGDPFTFNDLTPEQKEELKGDRGDDGANGTGTIERWNNTLSYVADADVLHNDIVWTAAIATLPGQEPGVDRVWGIKLKGVTETLEKEVDILYNNVEITPEIDLVEGVPVEFDGRYYYSNYPDSSVDATYEILEPITLQSGTNYHIKAEVDSNNENLKIVWLLRDAVTDEREPFLIEKNGATIETYNFEFTPSKDLKLIISRKKGSLTKVIVQEYNERKIYLTEADINVSGGAVGNERMDIFNKVDVLFNDAGIPGFSAGDDLIGIISADATPEVVGNRSQLIDVLGATYLLFTGHVEGNFTLASFDAEKLYRGRLIPEGDYYNYKVLIPAGVKYVMLSCYTQDQRLRSRMEVYSFKESYSASQLDVRLKNLEDRVYSITKEKQLQFSKPTCLYLHWDNNMILPSDTGIVTESGSVTVFDGNIFLFKAKCKLKVQGNSSSYATKKGYTIDLLNSADQKLTIKFGNWVALDSFHLKAYQSDSTKVRDVGACRIWHHLRSSLNFPDDMIYDVPFDNTVLQEQDKYNSSALYFTDGIPFVSYYRGQFWSVGIWRIKVARENYRMDNNNPKHVFLDGGWQSNIANFHYSTWEVRSPKMSGYGGEGTPIPDTAVLAKINRLSSWMAACINGSQDFAATAHNYLNVQAWLVFTIWIELIGHADANWNNQLMGTWDGNTWSPFPRDADVCLGLNAILAPHWRLTDETWLIETQPLPLIRDQMLDKLKATYRYLRENKILTHANLSKIIVDLSASIPYSLNKADIDKWGWSEALSEGGTKLSSVDHILTYLGNRLTWMDTQLL